MRWHSELQPVLQLTIFSLLRNKISDIFTRISSPKLHIQYAKAREADGHYKEAAQAYEAAGDYENAVRYSYFYIILNLI